MGGVYLRSAVRLLPTARGLGLHSTVEVRDVFRRVEAGGVVVLVCDDPGGSAGSRGGSEWHRASVVSTSYVQDLLKAGSRGEIKEVSTLYPLSCAVQAKSQTELPAKIQQPWFKSNFNWGQRGSNQRKETVSNDPEASTDAQLDIPHTLNQPHLWFFSKAQQI